MAGDTRPRAPAGPEALAGLTPPGAFNAGVENVSANCQIVEIRCSLYPVSYEEDDARQPLERARRVGRPFLADNVSSRSNAGPTPLVTDGILFSACCCRGAHRADGWLSAQRRGCSPQRPLGPAAGGGPRRVRRSPCESSWSPSRRSRMPISRAHYSRRQNASIYDVARSALSHCGQKTHS